MCSRILFALCLALVVIGAEAQKIKKSDKPIIENLQKHIQYLADDKLEGRRAGTEGERIAAEYITAQFKEIGITPKGSADYLQAFEIIEGKQINDATSLSLNGNKLELNKDFFPMVYSPKAKMHTLPAISVQESDMPWFLDLKEQLEENKSNPHYDLNSYIKSKAAEVHKKGASALVIYNTSSIDDKLGFNSKERADASAIPVIYVKQPAALKYLDDESATIDFDLVVDISDKKRTGNNVVGYIDNGAETTVVLGAHYDHLGYGEDNNSMLRTGEKLIHNGADDNASGTAALIELARMLKSSKLKKNNYLFIAFSGEELGLYGSKYFVENPTINIANINYMINMDMVGRMNDSSRTVTIGGYGTSPQWANVIVNKKKGAFNIRIDSSGTGPSDHTSFYRKDIPVLFYFTGLHTDYHKPSDDADKINYEGQLFIIKHIYDVIDEINDESSKLVFVKTREAQTSTSARFSVSLGIMPDYTFSGAGVRVDGVTEGRAAQKAGIKTGDVVTQLGEHPITSMESYMQALSKFKKGDATKVKFKRGAETLEASVQF